MSLPPLRGVTVLPICPICHHYVLEDGCACTDAAKAAAVKLAARCPACGGYVCETAEQRRKYVGQRCLCSAATREEARQEQEANKSLPTMDCFKCRPLGFKDTMHKHCDGVWVCDRCGRQWSHYYRRSR